MFVEPRIPPNTGNAIRLAAATGATLHLVEPLGFELDEPRVKRAGLDYHDLAHVRVHESFDSLCDGSPDSRVLAFTTGGKHSYADIMYKEDDLLVFGPEPTGLDDAVLNHSRVTHRVRIPMLAGRRSLNLSNAAALVFYEAWRQLGFVGADGPGAAGSQ